jgi:hypothetical protein
MTRVSLAREASCNLVVAGSDSQARLHGLWSNGQGNAPLKRKCAFDPRRADNDAQAMDATQAAVGGCVTRTAGS